MQRNLAHAVSLDSKFVARFDKRDRFFMHEIFVCTPKFHILNVWIWRAI